jgi:hypothetical protein
MIDQPTAIPNSKKLGGVCGLRGWGAIEHKVNQRLPTLKEEILGQTYNILKKTFPSTALFANLLVSLIAQLQNSMEQKCQQIQSQ